KAARSSSSTWSRAGSRDQARWPSAGPKTSRCARSPGAFTRPRSTSHSHARRDGTGATAPSPRVATPPGTGRRAAAAVRCASVTRRYTGWVYLAGALPGRLSAHLDLAGLHRLLGQRDRHLQHAVGEAGRHRLLVDALGERDHALEAPVAPLAAEHALLLLLVLHAAFPGDAQRAVEQLDVDSLPPAARQSRGDLQAVGR